MLLLAVGGPLALSALGVLGIGAVVGLTYAFARSYQRVSGDP